MNSAELRSALTALDEAAAKAGAEVLRCEAAHRIAVSRAVIHGDHTGADKSEAALALARVTYTRTVERRDEARKLLAESVKREKAEAQAVVRAEVEAELADIAAVARDIDAKFAEAVGQLVSLYQRETVLHRKTHDSFRQPWLAPQTMTAARSLSAYLAALAGGNPPDMKGYVSEVAKSAAHNVRSALHD